ncbi:MAG: J domain-containing protein [Dehalococcoidia bacterium]|nr:J domain-containing protein [Dehalococcoidia bacterium]MCA9845293.1 J domain-containing protein [Dehalococcoidia bacterium]MCA9855478.1 J domain-containing protein [Dehalococcoidia bacterium]
MANPRIVDYYAVLAIPPSADLMGIEAAYTRLSDELVRRSNVDDTANSALDRLNEAYDVLANPESRRQYDEVLFQTEIEILKRQQEREDRRRWIVRASIFSALSGIVLLQSAVLLWIGWDYIDGGVASILGPLWPGRVL